MGVCFCLAGNAGERTIAGEVGRAVLAEELGYNGIFISESLMSGFDPFQVMALSAMRTRRIHLGTAIMTMSFREAAVVAQSAATLNEISNGRAVLGLGTGDGTTYTMGRTATPLAVFEQGLRVIRDLVNGRPIHIPKGKEREEGELSLRAGRFPVPVYFAAAGPRSLRLAGRVADGVILGTGFDLRVLRWAREQIALGAREAGRSLSDIDLMGAGIMCVDEDRNRARELARARLANRAHHNFRFTMETIPPDELDAVKRFMENFDVTKPVNQRSDPRLVTEYLLQRFSIAGTAEECVRRVQQLEQAGIHRILLTLPPLVYRDVMKRWAEKVMPHFSPG
ncbi:MAG: LLM class flavin-dependent oxidoreductase [Candidatus Binatia bacterium]